ncbi:MAG TPA: hypothetical protein ENN46_00345 [Candidatus Woesearchaeota archaeon]|nr:hypothetical protein [Candidatus Woesearchaeota archaeon]
MLMATVIVCFFAVSLSGNAFASIIVEVHHPESEQTITELSDFRFDFNFTSLVHESALCTLHISPYGGLEESNLAKTEIIDNNTNTTWSLAALTRNISAGDEYIFRITCENSTSSHYRQRTFYTTLAPYAFLAPLEALTSESSITVCGFVGQPNTTVSIKRTDENSESLNETVTSSDDTPSPALATDIRVIQGAEAGQGYIVISTEEYEANIGEIVSGNYIEFDFHYRNCFKRYEISGTSPYEPGKTRINLSQTLEDEIENNLLFSVYGTERPAGWFEEVIGLLGGVNKVWVRANRSKIFHESNMEQIIYDNISPIITAPNYVEFNSTLTVEIEIEDYSEINFSSSWINLTKNGTQVDYINTTNLSSMVTSHTFNHTTKRHHYTLNYSNSSLEDGEYNLTFNFTDVLGQSSSKTVVIGLYTIVGEIEYIYPVPGAPVMVYEPEFFFNWSEVESEKEITYHYEFLESLSKGGMGGGYKVLLNGSTNSTNITINITSPRIKRAYQLKVTPRDSLGNIGPSTYSGLYIFWDLSPPVIQYVELVPALPYTNLVNNLRATWNYTHTYSEEIQHEYCIGEMADGNFGACKWNGTTSEQDVIITDISLENGKKYFLRVRGIGENLIPSEYSYINFTVDTDPPYGGWINYPTGKVSFSNELSLTGFFGNDSISGFAKGSIYVMFAPIDPATLNCGSFGVGEHIFTGYTPEFSITYTAEDGQCYKFFIRTWDWAGNSKDFFYAGELIDNVSYVDTTKPSPVTIYTPVVFTTSNTLYFNWTRSYDSESGIRRYHYELVDSLNNVIFSGTNSSNERHLTLRDLNLTNNRTYFLKVWAENGAGLFSNVSTSHGVFFMDTKPPAKVQIVNVSGGNILRGGWYYDLAEDTHTHVFFTAENGAICKVSKYNIGYTEVYNITNCHSMSQVVNGSDLYNCSLPTGTNGKHTYYISCKDSFGNRQGTSLSKEVNIVKTTSAPSISIISPIVVNDVLLFNRYYYEFEINISTFSPIGEWKYAFGNASSNNTKSNLVPTKSGSGFIQAGQVLEITNPDDEAMWFSLLVKDVFNRSTTQTYLVRVSQPFPKAFTSGLEDYYDKQEDIELGVIATSFKNISIIIRNSSKSVMLNFVENLDEQKNYKLFNISLNLTEEQWKPDKYTLNVTLTDKNGNSSTLIKRFYVDNLAPNVTYFGIDEGTSSMENTLYDTDKPTFRAVVKDMPDNKEINSGVKSVTVNYSVTYSGETESFTAGLRKRYLETWTKELPPGSFRPGSFVEYKIIAEDNAGNSFETSLKNFSIANRAPQFETDELSSHGYANVGHYERIQISDPDIFTNITCSINQTSPSWIYSNVSIAKISNEACMLFVKTSFDGTVNITVRVSDGIDSTDRVYPIIIRESSKISLDYVGDYVFTEVLLAGEYKAAAFDTEQRRIYVPKDEETSLRFSHRDIIIQTETASKEELDGIQVKFSSFDEETLSFESPELDLGAEKRHVPKKAYALEINKELRYSVVVNYSNFTISDPEKIKAFRIPYNFDSGEITSFSDGEEISISLNKEQQTISFELTEFSLIVIAEDTQTRPPRPPSSGSRPSGGSRGFISAPATCEDGIRNQDETDIDCGGSICQPCALDKNCNNDSDCISNYCLNGTCSVKPTCFDGIKNQDETDIDCGGSICQPCNDGRDCKLNSDCRSNYCHNGICRTPTCTDGIKNQDETDIDCGGVRCGPCEAGKACGSNSDCVSRNCVNGICKEATCDDGIKNQDETDIDCGGSSCPKCPDTRTCLRNSDCISNYCHNGACRTPTCNDGIQNQGEEGIDCGGPCPQPCEEEKPGLVTQDVLALGGVFLSLFLAIIIILVIAFKNKRKRRVVEKVIFRNMNQAERPYSLNRPSRQEGPEMTQPAGQDKKIAPDETIVKEYLRKLVQKMVSDGKGYYDIKSEVIRKGYKDSVFLAFVKEEYMKSMIEQIKQDIGALRERGFSDDQIKEYLIRSGFSENDIEKVFR